MSLSEKVLKGQLRKVGANVVLELEPCHLNAEIETASCFATNGNNDLSNTSNKSNTYGITDGISGYDLKRKFKESRKRSLSELLVKCMGISLVKYVIWILNEIPQHVFCWLYGNGFKDVNSSVAKNSTSVYQTTGRCLGELMEDDAGDTVQTNEMHNCTRYSEKHQPRSSDMFSCICGNSDRDEFDQLLECNRFLIKGYKGRKREGFLHNHPQDANGNAGCLVPQEQLNAWLHIHQQRPQRKGLHPKLTSSSVGSDCRVVEYVGEIVGLRVADRRESEYHSGKKLQHKSACYFFRIDKEHIIDATRKGGIARFVNHSCQPNCVAKVISVRNEKKVVFFAERDIYPGEEITYNYHFNHEDEGERIPCYCNSKNCRRYLN
ncbi:UNVERIFIED_CONTAM: Histone-lysine N-methyltransferase, H3 lysine-4 specific [Sesamum angustifolium]|uniref:Histone-lysine N-methyltransferase, H3 lysine-4 specific n=1 Tax=Sesamum angustifolium TaxID=2727405 RepID=A0AAW2J9A7_9LAMI